MGQIIISIEAHLASGILFIISTSPGTKMPSTMSMFHCLVEASIKESIVASSIDSITGEEALVGCFMGNQWRCQMLTDFMSPMRQQLDVKTYYVLKDIVVCAKYIMV